MWFRPGFRLAFPRIDPNAVPPPPGDTTAPIISGPATVSVAENTTAVATYTANETVTWSLAGTDAARFSISGGSLAFLSAPNFEAPTDGGANNVYNVTVEGADSAGNVGTRSVAVTVTDVAEGGITVDTASTTAVTFPWLGDVTASGFTAGAVLAAPSSDVRLVASPDPTFATGVIASAPVASSGNYALATMPDSALNPDTAYHWAVRVGSTIYANAACRGEVRTLPAASAFGFRVASASCSVSFSGRDSGVWSHLLGLANRPRFFIQTGDWHYEDDTTHAALNLALGGLQGEAARKMGFLWQWGDHDFLDNSSDSNSTGTSGTTPAQAMAIRRAREPLPGAMRWFSGATEPLGWTKVVGRVRFIAPDQRSPKINGTQMWGAAQRTRLFQEFTAARDAGQVAVYVSDLVPSEAGFVAADRTALWDHILSIGMQARTVVLCGDMHAVAFDTGVNHDFATGGGCPIPVICLAPIRQDVSNKGGPWSQGPFPTTIGTRVEQAGYIDVTDTGGDTITLATTAFNGAGATIATNSVTLSLVAAPPPPPPAGLDIVQVARNDNTTSAGEASTVALAAPPTAGNLLVLVALPDKAPASITPPAGFALLAGSAHLTGSQMSGAIYTKVADGSEQSLSYLATGGTTSTSHSVYLEVAGAHPTDPIPQMVRDISFATTTPSANPRVTALPSLTTAHAGMIVVGVWGNDSASGVTAVTTRGWTGGMATLVDVGFGSTTGLVSGSSPAISVGELAVPAAGTVVDAEFSYTGGTTDQQIAFLFALRPAA